MFFIPYRVDAPIRRWPIANFVILALLLICYLIESRLTPAQVEDLAPFVLAKGRPLGLIGYSFLHGGILHLAGNMLFLWAFGNAVCVRVGNAAYPFIFVFLGAVAGLTHLSLNGEPAIGASGAINGLVGMFLVWFPMHRISIFYLWPFGVGVTEIRSYWIILFWLVFDVLGAALGLSGVAYWAHVGGFAAGFGLAALLLQLGRVRMEPYERSLLKILLARKDPDDELAPIGPLAAAAPALAMPLAPPEGYFVLFPCACGAGLRAPRKRAGEECTCPKCSARTTIPGAED